ncbi:MAG: hypothetical protein KJ749_01425, partial [Planctomycetes bacterium]|nr:hypothetical protein [Planctomycetota bacterium]
MILGNDSTSKDNKGDQKVKKLACVLAIIVVCGGLAGVANADPYNTRPVTINGASLQGVLDGMTVSGPGIDVYNDQSPAALFTNDASGSSVATMIIEIAGYAGSNEFGIYSASNPTNKAMVFAGSDVSGDVATISFMANGDIKVNGAVVANGFSSTFGFYTDVYADDGNVGTLDYTVYSEDSLNPGGNAQALVYQGDNATRLQLPGFAPGTFTDSEFIIAFE